MSKGIKGWMFVLVVTLVLAAVFVSGLLFVAPNVEVQQETLGSVDTYLVVKLVELALIAIISFFLVWVFFSAVLDTPLRNLKKKFREGGNDSHAIITVGIILSVAWMVASSGGQSLWQHLYHICTRGSLAYAISVFVTVIMARIWGVKTMDQFRDHVESIYNDSYSILVAAVLVISMIVMV